MSSSRHDYPVHLRDYLGTPAHTLRLWAHRHADDFSSDIGVFDHEGYLYYIGRKDDVINLGGYKIAPTDVENLALQSGLVHECLCIEDRDEYGVPYIKLLVVVEDKSKFDPVALNAFLSDRLEKYKIPRTIEAVDTLIKTFNGKTDRKAYRKKL